ncbi:MAG: glucokinase [Novosphingobium sp.]
MAANPRGDARQSGHSVVLIVAGDIGGTNARFALAEVAKGKVLSLGEPVVLPASEFTGLAEAWQAFGERLNQPLPHHAAFGVAGPVTGGPVRFVNSHWVVDPASLAGELGLDCFSLLNDFGAMAHAVDALGPEHIVRLCGPDVPLPGRGAISVIGPGTGLGVAVLQRRDDGVTVLETEGSHVHFAPLDEAEKQVSAAISTRHGRCSIERVVSGPGLGEVVRTFAPGDGRSDAQLWHDVIAGRDARAFDLFFAAYGAAVGDLSLAHGSLGVALTGGLTNRIRHLLPSSRFHARFCAKGRYRQRMESIPVKLITHPQPGLYGAAAAFAREHAS